MLTMLPGDRQHRTVSAARFSALWKTRPLPVAFRVARGPEPIKSTASFVNQL
jgi:hypothetical protein